MTDKEKIARCERAIAQLASGLRVMAGWRPDQNGQDALQAILDEQREIIRLEKRPHQLPEQRERAVA